uniref:Uncharacterized protein n=1 Tax=Oryza brachyantha TaxID=4533 RepID=J3N840_ORYBR
MAYDYMRVWRFGIQRHRIDWYYQNRYIFGSYFVPIRLVLMYVYKGILNPSHWI